MRASLLSLFLLGCSSGPSVVVSLSNVPAEADTLQVLLSLNGGPAGQVPVFRPQSQERYSFGLHLPGGSAGALSVSVGAFSQKGCLITTGTAALQLAAEDRDKELDLALQGPPAEYAATCKAGPPAIRSIAQDFVQGRKVLRVLGWGFQTGTRVLLGGAAATGLSVQSVEQLLLDEPPLPLPSGKTSVPLTVQNPDGAKDQATADLYKVTFADPSGNQYPLGAGNNPESLAVGDVDGDGRPDLVMAGNYLVDPGLVTIMLNQGGGHFSAPAVISVPGGASSVNIGDVDGDHLPDLAVSNRMKGTVTVLFNQGKGPGKEQFSGQHLVTFPAGVLPYGMVLADEDGDGRLDVIVVNDSYNTDGLSNISVLRNQGSGKLGPPVAILSMPFASFGDLEAHDLNGDGRPDLVVSQLVPVMQNGTVTVGGAVGVLLNQGGSFPPMTSDYPCNATLGAVAFGDLSERGYSDLAVTGIRGSDNNQNGLLSLLFNDGTGAFAANQSDYDAGPQPFAVVAADLDGDGKQDLAVSNPIEGSPGLVTLLLNQGHGAFPRSGLPSYPMGVGPGALVAADLDGDGKIDLAVANAGNPKTSLPGSLTVFLNTSR